MALHVRTPLIKSIPLSAKYGASVFLKLDNLQPSGSFKIRGIGKTVQNAVAKGTKHIMSSSGGNAGLAAAYAGYKLGVPVTVVLPHSAPAMVTDALQLYNAEAIFHGSQWSEAHAHAQALAADLNAHLVHPFAEETTWDGHSTIVDELVEDMPEPPDALVTVCGGGGLLMGLLRGLQRAQWSHIPTVVVETKGADSLAQSLQKKELVTLPGIESIAKTLGAATVDETMFKECLTLGSDKVRPWVTPDSAAVRACAEFLDDHRFLVEPSCGAGLASIYEKSPALGDSKRIVVIVCGGSLITRGLLEDFLDITS
eukprot:m.28745 g.28745  ORF g.28745 m.28745 type:complete len:312 (-) comp8030_c0_seq1:1960-2895(-)